MKELILDTETTGLGENDEIIEICIMDIEGNTLFDSLIKPIQLISEQSTAIHGITDSDVKDAPCWTEVSQEIENILRGNKVLIYNSGFDIKMLNNTFKKYGIKKYFINYLSEKAKQSSEAIYIDYRCVMSDYARKWGEYNDYYNSYVWQSLSNACSQQRINISDLRQHRAQADCEATRRLVLHLKNNAFVDNPVVKQRTYNENYRSKLHKKIQKLIPKNTNKYPYFGRDKRPTSYKTYSQLRIKDLDSYVYAGTCCDSYGHKGDLFKPKLT